MQVFIFHGDKDPTVPVGDSRKMVERFRQLGWLGKNVRYTEYPGVAHDAWMPAYKDAALLRTLAAIKRDPAAPKARRAAAAGVRGGARACSARASRGSGRTSTSTARTARPTRSRPARALANALADWGPMVGARFTVKADAEVTADDRARFSLVLVGAAPLNALAEPRRDARRAPARRSGLPRRSRPTPRSRAAARWCWAR